MEKIKKVLSYILAAIMVIFYIPYLLLRILVPVFVGLTYIVFPILALVAVGYATCKGIVELSHRDKFFTVVCMVIGMTIEVHLIRFIIHDLKGFKKWLWKWGKEWYDGIFKSS